MIMPLPERQVPASNERRKVAGDTRTKGWPGQPARFPRGALLGACLALGLVLGPAGPGGVAVAADQLSQEEIMKAYQKAAQVTQKHELLRKMAGTWQATTRSWMNPAAPPQVSEGTNVGEMIMGGRFLKVDFQNKMIGATMQGLGLYGYDNLKQEYCGIWLDSMSTSIMSFAGHYDPDRRQLILFGQSMDAATGKETSSRLEYTFLSDDKYIFALYAPGPDGKEFKWVQITYERQ